MSRRVAPHTCVRVLCEAEPLGPSRISVVDQTKVKDLACAAEELTYLFLGEACGRMTVNE